MAGYNKTKTTPFRILAYLLYGQYEWITYLDVGVVRIETGPASRALRVRSADFWSHLYWLEEQKLITTIRKEPKRGSAVIHLTIPPSFYALELTNVKAD